MAHKNILVTGGTGLLGAHLLFEFCKQGFDIVATKRATSNMQLLQNIFGREKILLNHITWLTGDLCDPIFADEVTQNVQTVFHCAGKVSFGPGEYDSLIKTNVDATANIVNASLLNGVEHFIHVSSVAAIGRTENQSIISENTEWKPSSYNSNYALSKYQGEMEVWRAIAEGLNAVIVNPVLILGHGNWTNDSSSIIGTVFNGMPFYTNGGNGFVDVDDVVRILLWLMENRICNERYIICGDNKKYKDVLEKMAIELNKKPPTIEAGKFLCGLAWRWEKLKSMFTGIPSIITKETVSTALNTSEYDNSKITALTKMTFTPFEKTVKKYCKIFLDEQKIKGA
jgi:nucleoside-diphosphate-sugar epimerase